MQLVPSTTLVDLFEAIWNEAAVPQDFKDATIFHIYKRKGDRSSCDNHWGISLLSTGGKILARVLVACLIINCCNGQRS